MPVREYLTGPDLGTAIASIGTKHGLHIDVIGKLSETVGDMLSGFITPSQLMSEMTTLGIAQSKTTDIARELNDSVFRPLHQKIRGEGTSTAAPTLVSVPAPLKDASGFTAESPQQPSRPLPPAYEPLPPPTQVPQPIIGAPHAPQPSARSYSADPYREPIE